MVGNIAPIHTVTTIQYDQHNLPGVPGTGTGKVGDRYYDKMGKAWYTKTNATTWLKIS
jgi:hypothetical protein